MRSRIGSASRSFTQRFRLFEPNRVAAGLRAGVPDKVQPLTRYLALLRGINVGGRNPVPMTALRACLERGGFDDVITYIQSGNVVFGSPPTSNASLTRRVEAMLSEEFSYAASAVVLSTSQVRTVVERAPSGFGDEPARFAYDVIFLKPPLKAAAAMKHVAVKPEVDTAAQGSGALYFSRLKTRATESRLSRIVSSPIYPNITIRNWRTTTKLLEMLERPRD
jgi:uncharacterized protein (DUF1697 family)